MKRRKFNLIVALLFFFGLANAQQILSGEVRISQIEMKAFRDSVAVKMHIDLSALQMKSGKAVEICPHLLADGRYITMPAVRVMGRRRYLYFLRNNGETVSDSTITVKWRKGCPSELSYRAVVPVSQFPLHLKLMASGVRTTCRCDIYEATPVVLAERIYVSSSFQPKLAYLRPAHALGKEKMESGSAYIDFKVGSHELLADYRDNATELNRMGQRILEVMNNEKIILNRIVVSGYASPEGKEEKNKILAENRTQSLIDYLVKAYQLPAEQFVMSFGKEDWTTLRKYVADGQFAEKDDILALIDDSTSWDEKEGRLRRHHPAVYMDLKKICFPRLRRTDYVICYTPRVYNLHEVRQLVLLHPSRLTLNEMYAAMESYPEGSVEYNEIAQIVANSYPEAPEANLNAANVALQCKDFVAAEKYLEKAGNSGEAIMARGLLAYFTGDFDGALRLLRQSAGMGVKGASQNLEDVKRLITEY